MASKTEHKTKIKDPEMKIFKESCLKEKNAEKLNQDFKINQPNKIRLQTQKPNNNPFLLMKIQKQGKKLNGVDIEEKLNNDLMKSDLSNEMSTKLKTVTQIPQDKWTSPQTSNQEIGWFHNLGQSESKFIFKRQSCNQTTYAGNYYAMRHTSLFSKPKKQAVTASK